MLHDWYMWSCTHVCKICFPRIGSIRSGVSVGAYGDPMAGTPDSDTTGRAEPPDGCTCETAAMARCIRSLCLEYHRWLKALLMASLCLVFVGWVLGLPQRPTCESHKIPLHAWKNPESQTADPLNPRMPCGLDATLNQWGIFKNIELTACRPDMILYTVALTLCPELSDGVISCLHAEIMMVGWIRVLPPKLKHGKTWSVQCPLRWTIFEEWWWCRS